MMYSIVSYLLLVAAGMISCETLAPLMIPKDEALIIPDKYIVVFKGNQQPDHVVSSQSTAQINHASWLQTRLSGSSGSKLEHAFNLNGLSGYTGYFAADLIDEIRKRDEIEYVEADQIMYAMNKASTVNLKPKFLKNSIMKEMRGPVFLGHRSSASRLKKSIKTSQSSLMNQSDAPWGLKRISKASSALKALFSGRDDTDMYRYPSSAGQNVDVYIVDTGINVEHEDFEGRARWGKTIPLFDLDIDGNGHGTHCAGTIGSKTYGVAKKANLIAVKVLRTSGFGTNSDVIKGVEWVTRQHRKNAAKGRQSVANMSLGGGRSVTLEKVVNRAVESGVHFAVAAGNDAEDACEYSPAAASGPITVGASTSSDSMAYFSNFGKCVDIFAPGLDILSTWIGSKDAVNTISGTSMASPHVAGVLALYLAEGKWTPKALKAELKNRASKDSIEKVPQDTVNLLVNTVHLISSLEKGQDSN
jgi:cerevisin